MTGQRRVSWGPILTRSVEIVNSYDTGVTLRQLFYRLVSEGLLPNTQQYYRRLSEKTAQARRDGWFPTLLDRTREVHRLPDRRSPANAVAALARGYTLDRTRGQPVSLYVGVEKVGMIEQLRSWFGDLGVPIIALGGYASQTFVDEVIQDVVSMNRPAMLAEARRAPRT